MKFGNHQSVCGTDAQSLIGLQKLETDHLPKMYSAKLRARCLLISLRGIATRAKNFSVAFEAAVGAASRVCVCCVACRYTP